MSEEEARRIAMVTKCVKGLSEYDELQFLRIFAGAVCGSDITDAMLDKLVASAQMGLLVVGITGKGVVH